MNRRGFLNICAWGAASAAVITTVPSVLINDDSLELFSLPDEQEIKIRNILETDGCLWNIKEGRNFEYNELYISKDAIDDIRAWGIDKIDEITRKDLLVSMESIRPIGQIQTNKLAKVWSPNA